MKSYKLRSIEGVNISAATQNELLFQIGELAGDRLVISVNFEYDFHNGELPYSAVVVYE